MKYAWLVLGWLAVALGIVGIVLPLLPTTPFLLLAAFAFSRGSERWHHWLINHPNLGPPILQWQQEQAIARRVKYYASISLIAVFLISAILASPPWQKIPLWALAVQAIVLIMVATFLWTRAEPVAPKQSIKEKVKKQG